jgi:hypothetical protein
MESALIELIRRLDALERALEMQAAEDRLDHWRGSAAVAPDNPAEGDIWNDTSAGNTVKIYANADWRTLS